MIAPRRQVLAVRAAAVLALAFSLPEVIDRLTEVLGGLVLISFQGNTTAWGLLDRYFNRFNSAWVFGRVRMVAPWLVIGAAGIAAFRAGSPRVRGMIRRLSREPNL